jgi:hypothetical protein
MISQVDSAPQVAPPMSKSPVTQKKVTQSADQDSFMFVSEKVAEANSGTSAKEPILQRLIILPMFCNKVLPRAIGWHPRQGLILVPPNSMHDQLILFL